MAKEVHKKINTLFKNNKPHSIDVGQFEYTTNSLFTYGSLAFILSTLAITYVYLLATKIKN